MENENQKPLTLNDLTDYTQKVLLPALDEKLNKLVSSHEFNGLKNEVGTLRTEFQDFKNESLTNQDAILKKLDILMEDKEIRTSRSAREPCMFALQASHWLRKYQEEKKKKLFAIMIKAMKEHSILSQKELEEIAHLDIF